MTLSSLPSYGELDPASGPAAETNPLTIGPPTAWRTRTWKLAALAFLIAWMMQSWEGAKPLLGSTKMNYLTQDLWKVLVTLTCCYATYGFFRQRTRIISLVLSLLIAATAMAVRSL